MKQQNPVLNPALQGVLSCLDVQLDAELTRYRRQKAKARSQSANGKANPLAALDLKAFNAQPLRGAISPGFALAQGVSVRHPEPDRPRVSAPSESTVVSPDLSFKESAQSIAHPPIAQPVTTHEPIADPHALDFQDRADRFALTEALPKAADPSASKPSPQPPDNPYVILTEPYQPAPINWADLSIAADDPTILEVPISEAPNSSIALEEAETVLTSLVLPAELSEAELFALAGLSAASLAIGSGGSSAEKDWADYKISDYEISDYEIPDYEISDEENPWPDELDEEPYALDTDFAAEVSEQGFGSGSDFALDDDMAPVAIESPLPSSEALGETRLEPESAALPGEETDPLLLPSAEHRHPSSPLVPPSVLPVYPGPHHLKPLGVVRSQIMRPPMEDYLASSEALLDNLDEEDDRQNWPQRLSNLFTPQGIGSALLLIFSALAVSMVLLNPELVSHWKLGRFGGSAPESVPPTQPEVVIQESPVEGPNPNPYNLSSQEFLNLDLGNLSKVNPQTTLGSSPTNPDAMPPSPTAVNGLTPDPSAATASGSEMFSDLRDSVRVNESESEGSTAVVSQPSEPIRPRAAAPVAAPVPRTAPVFVEPETSQSPPRQEQSQPSPSDSSSSNTSGGSYVVSIPYTSDQLLDQSQTIVPDAYLKNTDQGANIQFGVFSDPESAAALAEQLQEQGIAVEVIPAEP